MNFIDQWLSIIRNCTVSNTYKMAWAKAITKISVEQDDIQEGGIAELEITLHQIAEKVLSYYWDQTIFFDLNQGSNPLKPPRIVTLTKQLIEQFQMQIQSTKPVKFLRANVQSVCPELYQQALSDVVQALKADVSYRFVNLGGEPVADVYHYYKGDDSLWMSTAHLTQLRDNYIVVFEAINYRWAQILEDYNQAPRICKKVRIIDDQTVRRKPLKQFSRYLDAENPNHVCFLCGNAIADETPAIDHVIPWSFLYSDDLWNLVYAHQYCNSVKSNAIPSQDTIHQLEQRNIRLLDALESQGTKDKQVSELTLAIEKDFVKKFWIACQG